MNCGHCLYFEEKKMNGMECNKVLFFGENNCSFKPLLTVGLRALSVYKIMGRRMSESERATKYGKDSRNRN